MAGFSLVELLIVISIIGILSAVLYANFNEGSARGRDIERQSKLREVQAALELYKLDNGRYPAGCRGAGVWSGQSGTSYACAVGSQYIVGLVPKYLSALPVDLKLNGSNSGYVYTTNADGSVYKFMAKATVESEVVTKNHQFKSCDSTNNDSGMCDKIHTVGGGFNSGSTPNHCGESNTLFKTSFAVWGGYATTTVSPTNGNYNNFIERYTEDVICDIE